MQWLVDQLINLFMDQAGFVDRGTPGDFDYDLADMIFNTAWHDLDLSHIVPVGAKAIALTVYFQCDDANVVFLLRNKDNTGPYNVSRCYGQVGGLYMAADMIIGCNSNRMIQYRGYAAAWTYFKLTVRGWSG